MEKWEKRGMQRDGGGKGGESWHQNDMHEQQSEQGEKAALPFTLKLAPLLSVLRKRKMKKNKRQKKKKTRQGWKKRERERKRDARLNFQTLVLSLMFPANRQESCIWTTELVTTPHCALVWSEGKRVSRRRERDQSVV